eukprot:6329486-Pyramimonas_sp.AAC.1
MPSKWTKRVVHGSPMPTCSPRGDSQNPPFSDLQGYPRRMSALNHVHEYGPPSRGDQPRDTNVRAR